VFVVVLIVLMLPSLIQANQVSGVMMLLRTLWDLLQVSVLLTLVFILYGASLYDHIFHTYLAAVYVFTLSWLDPPIFSFARDHKSKVPTTTTATHTTTQLHNPRHVYDSILLHLRGHTPQVTSTAAAAAAAAVTGVVAASSSSTTWQRQRQRQFILSQTIVYTCWICTVPMQILLLYDRGYQIQRYPVPIILGSTIGWILGVLLGTIRALVH
jgi:hypothetical protein